MGKLLTGKDSKGTITTKDTNAPITAKNKMYKPISDFAWKDATVAEIHKNSIRAYSKFAF